MSFPRYPAYKDSGVVWLGEIPRHWDVKPMKWVIERNDGGVWGDEPAGEGDTIVLRSTEQTVDGRWQIEDPAFRRLSDTEKRGSLLEAGDLLVTKSSGSALHIGKTTLVTPEVAALGCCYSNFMQRLRLKPIFYSRLAWYLMNNEIARTQFDLLSNSTTGLANLNGTMLGELVAPIPPLDEQVGIASFLDHETAKIDALVAEQERLIEMLKEKRQAVISHAVTKGLDPSVPMKDSGVEWLGEVPAHWEVKQIKHVISLLTDYTSNGSFASLAENVNYLSEGYSRLVRLTDLREDLNNDGIFVDQAAHHFLAKSELFGGEVLIANVGAYAGYACLMPSGQGKATLGPNMYLINFKKSITSNEFGHLCLMSPSVQEQLKLAATSTAQPKLNKEDVKSCVIAIPPTIDEQTKILAFVAVRRSEFDSLIAETKRGIALLQERRTALISAAVTGQIDVRKMVPALPA